MNWVPLAGQWNTDGDPLRYLGPSEPQAPFGLNLSDGAFKDGSAGVDIAFPDSLDGDSAARIVLAYDARTGEYISLGVGGYQRAVVLSRFRSGVGWTGEAVAGDWRNLRPGQRYHVEAAVRGQAVALSVDGVRVLDHRLPEPLTGTQAGLYAFGVHPVDFYGFRVGQARRPQGFVVMEFSGRYDSLYREVLVPVAEQEGVELRRADEITGPGIILQDIVKDIGEATLVVAEATPPNPNVFYELGYAHALNKPTNLLVSRSDADRLPVDIAGFRCIFYEDSIGGRSRVEREFRKHLRAILGESGSFNHHSGSAAHV